MSAKIVKPPSPLKTKMAKQAKSHYQLFGTLETKQQFKQPRRLTQEFKNIS